MRGIAGLLLAVALAGCTAAPTGPTYTPTYRPTYTEEELAQRCARSGGWWHRDDLMGGFCEFQSPGMF